MGVPPFLVASTVNVAMGQRLVRTICQSCKEKRVLTESEVKSLSEILPELKKEARIFYTGKGCDECTGTGYHGRTGIREVLEVNDEIRQLIMNHANASQIKDAAVKNGMMTMLKDGLQKALQGITTVEEVLRIIYD